VIITPTSLKIRETTWTASGFRGTRVATAIGNRLTDVWSLHDAVITKYRGDEWFRGAKADWRW
jgi:hypothetical protein